MRNPLKWSKLTWNWHISLVKFVNLLFASTNWNFPDAVYTSSDCKKSIWKWMNRLGTLKQKQHRKNSILQRNFHQKQEIQFLIFMQEYPRFSFSLWWIWQIDSIQLFSSNFLFFWMTNFSHSSMIVFKHVQLYETPFKIHKNEYFLTLTKTLKHEFSLLLYMKSRRQNENKKVSWNIQWSEFEWEILRR